MDMANSMESCVKEEEETQLRPDKKRPRMELTVHPLLMDHVIEEIFSHASATDFCETVCQFRLVSKLWCSIATKKFRESHGQINFENDFNRDTARFVEVMQNCQDFPFKSFKFTGGFVLYKPYRGDFSYDNIFEKLLQVCCTAVKELEFYTHNPSDLTFPKSFPSGIDFQNLRVLTFKMCVYFTTLQMQMPSLLESFFKSSPNLEILNFIINTTDGEITEDQYKLIECFGDVISSQLPKTCKHLKLNMPLTDCQLERFSEQNVYLHSLNVDFRNSPVSASSLVKLLVSQQHTLRDLQLIECPVRIVEDSLFFPCLLRLRIEGRAILPSFSFKQVLPVLDTFELVFYWIYQEEKWLINIFEENTYSDSIRHLKICCWVTDTDVQIFEKIATNFPRLKKVQLNVDSFMVLKEIFRSMKYIEDLEMSLGLEFWKKHGGEVDAILTGLPLQYIVNRNDNFLDNTELPATLLEPSLRNLQQLISLKIVAFQADEVNLTDITVHYGFLKMKSLKHLTLDMFPISDAAIDSLKKSVNLDLLPDRRYQAFCA